ncbi:hypothetical protein [Halorubellus salinus]|uniref:hypothetical protein n=1 Tax=Halorubellus salinus TaxID=755309 RepID=UPI001D096FD0|nr:hypothetical protein [Halorubellus salinus]
MNTHADTSSESTVSITDSGLPTFELAVQSDTTDVATVVVETQLPDAIDPGTVAVDADDCTVYANGDVRWRSTLEPEDRASVTLGVPVTDPETIDELVDAPVHVVPAEDADPPVVDDEPVDPVDATTFDAAEPTDRVPEVVYERVHEHTIGSESTPGAEPTPDATSDDASTAAQEDETASNAVVSAPAVEPARADEAATGVEPSERAHANAERATEHADSETTEHADSEMIDDGQEWTGDAFENALRVHDDRSRADEAAYHFQVAFTEDASTDCAIEVLEGLLNGTTVYSASPTLPDLESGANPDELAVTISSALDEDDIVGALQELQGVTVETFEHVDVDGVPAESIDSNADQQFQLLDEALDPAEYDEFAAEVDALEEGTVDFGSEPVSFDELVENPDSAWEFADDETGDPTDESTTADETTTTTGESTTADASRVAEQLLDELESGGVTERERVELRRRLGIDPRTSTEARIDHLQTRVEKLTAYTDALEAFLDENGTARDVLEDLQADVGSLHERSVAAAEDRDELRADVDDVEAKTGDIEAKTDDIEAKTDAFEEAFEAVDARVETIESEQAAERERVDGLASAVRSNSDDIDHLAADVREDVDELADAVDDLTATVESIDERLATLSETVEQNARVREKLESLTS